jgi:hypothetical protein
MEARSSFTINDTPYAAIPGKIWALDQGSSEVKILGPTLQHGVQSEDAGTIFRSSTDWRSRLRHRRTEDILCLCFSLGGPMAAGRRTDVILRKSPC